MSCDVGRTLQMSCDVGRTRAGAGPELGRVRTRVGRHLLWRFLLLSFKKSGEFLKCFKLVTLHIRILSMVLMQPVASHLNWAFPSTGAAGHGHLNWAFPSNGAAGRGHLNWAFPSTGAAGRGHLNWAGLICIYITS